MVESWQLGAIASGVIALAYFAISATILSALVRGGQLRDNPLAALTGAIFFTCAAGHATHLEHLFLGPEVAAAREAFDWHLTWVDTVTAAVGVAYWQQRGRLGVLLRPAMFMDRAARARHASRVRGAVLSELVVARMALDVGDDAAVAAAVERAAAATRAVLDELDADVVRAA